MKLSRKGLVRKLDKAFSLYIRALGERDRGHCAFCPKPIQHCFHFLTRAKYSIRWDERNAIASCAGCNMRNEFDPHDFIQYFLNTFGVKAYDQLVADGHKLRKFERYELEEMAKMYDDKRKAL